MRQTFSVNFYCRPSKKDRKGLAPIELSLVLNGKRTYLRLPRKERPEEFTAALNNKQDNKIKVYCENQRIRVNDILEEMQYANREITAESLKACIVLGTAMTSYTLGDLWSDIILNKRNDALVGDIKNDTFAKYARARDTFYQANGFNPKTPAKDVELGHVTRYQAYLRHDLGFEQATAYNYHSRAKAAFTLAFNRGKISANPYAGYRMIKGDKKEIIFLSSEELSKIASKELGGRLDRVRDLFLFQCYSGLSYADMASLSPRDFHKEGGIVFVNKARCKTQEPFKAAIFGEGIRVLEKYNYALPVLVNQKYNAYLKEIQALCGIDKRLHTHLGRTTYISYLYNKGIDPTIIAEIVGHSSCKTTLKYYARMDNATIVEALKAKKLAGPTSKGTKATSLASLDWQKLLADVASGSGDIEITSNTNTSR